MRAGGMRGHDIVAAGWSYRDSTVPFDGAPSCGKPHRLAERARASQLGSSAHGGRQRDRDIG